MYELELRRACAKRFRGFEIDRLLLLTSSFCLFLLCCSDSARGLSEYERMNNNDNFCTIPLCTEGHCSVQERNCDDGTNCTLDSCSEEAQGCLHEPRDELCDDGLRCNGAEICDPEVGCLPGDEPTCDDGLECTDDSCDQDLDECVHTPNDDACDDGSSCNGVETCDPETGCLSGEFLECDDGLFCNGEELCDPEEGCVAGPPPDCDDGIDCTHDACDEYVGGCIHEPDDTLCDNRLYCDGSERCDETEGCVAGEPVLCVDDDPCSEDLCDEEADSCLSRPADGLPCDSGGGPESGHCLAGECVEAGCGDGFVDLGLEECDSGPDGTVGCTSECLSVDFRLSGLDPEPDRNGTQILFEMDRAVATLADGRFVAVWTRNINSGCGLPDWPEALCGKDVEGRFFTVDGETDGPVMVLNPDPDMRQQMPVVAPLGEGFLVAWVGDDRSTGDRDDIFVRAFDAMGGP